MASDLQGLADWRLLELVEEGEETLVYRAVRQVYAEADPEAAPQVAIEMLRPTTAEDATLVEAFERRAAAARDLEGPGLVAVLETGRADGLPYLVRELVDGLRLASLPRRRRGRLGVRAAAPVLDGVLAALEAAAEASKPVVHGRLGPEHVVLTTDGAVWLTGFGVDDDPRTDLRDVTRLAHDLTERWPAEVDAWLDRLQADEASFAGPAEARAALPASAFDAATLRRGRRQLARSVRQRAEGTAETNASGPAASSPARAEEAADEEAGPEAIAEPAEAAAEATTAAEAEVMPVLQQARAVAWLCGGLLLLGFALEIVL